MSSYSKSGRLTKEDKELSQRSLRSVDLELLEPDPPFWTKTSWLQLGYGIWVNLTLMNIGLCLAFSAVAIPQLKDPDSDIPITKNEEALIASILTLSSPIGCLVAGILLDRCGRKAGLIWCHVPIAIGWFYTAFAKYSSGIITGRVIAGVGIGMAMAAPRAYITEITLPNMRGVIGALPNLAISLGLTIQAVLGSFLAWRLLCILCGGYATIMLCANNFLPDTPYYILLHSTASAARLTLKRFRSSKFNVEGELQSLEEFKSLNNIRSLTFCETRKALTQSSACKPFGIILYYITLMHFSGVNVVTTYAVEILQLAHSSVDAHLGNVILAMTRIVLGLVTSFLLFRVGRRPLALMSAVGVGVIGLILGGYLYTGEGGRSPLVMLVAFVGFAVPGYHTLPTLMMFELFPLQVRGILSGIVLSSANLLMSAVIHTYPAMRDNMGLANTFITYGSASLFGAIVLYFILPETKGLTLQEIEEYFNHRRFTLVSERKLRSQVLSSKDFRSDSSYYKDKNKKKKRLRIVSSDDEEVPNEKKRVSKDLDKKASDFSYDYIVIVYDEDLIDCDKKDNLNGSQKERADSDKINSVDSSKKNNVDINKKDSVDSDKKDNVDRGPKVDIGHGTQAYADREKTGKKDNTEQDNTDEEIVNTEGKNKTPQDNKAKEKVKSKVKDKKAQDKTKNNKIKDKTTQDKTEKKNEDGDEKDKNNNKDEASKPGQSAT